MVGALRMTGSQSCCVMRTEGLEHPSGGEKRSPGLGLRDGWGQLVVWQQRQYSAGVNYTSKSTEEEKGESQFGQSQGES